MYLYCAAVMKVVIIGSGFGGLSAACLLAKKGYSVTVIEKNDQVGGRAGMLEKNGYRFDMGPSWYLMPDVFEKFYNELGTTADEQLTLQRLDPSYRIYFENETLDIGDHDATVELFERIEPGAGAKLKEYLKIAEYKYDVAINEFLYKEYKSVWDFINFRLMKEGSNLHVFDSFDKYTRRYFKDEKLNKILQYSIVFLGGAPKNTPGLYSLMSHVDFNLGVWYPKGGMNAVAKSYEKIARELGVTFVTSAPVQRIIVEDGKAVGVQANNTVYDADVVVSNADYHHTETQLLSREHQSYPQSYWDKRTVAPSAFIMYMGAKKRVDLEHHNLFLMSDWVKHFDTIFDNPGWPDKFSYYVCAPSKTDTVAPEGCENMFVLLPIASGIEDTPEIREKYKELVLADMEKHVGAFRDELEVCEVFTLNDFQERYNSFKGTALGLSHTLMQTAFFRPSHRSKKVGNLYYTGHYTHPGIGVPMTLISSTILRDIL